MVKSTSKAKYRRLLLLYSLVIIIPGTFLSILAYRGIQGNVLAAQLIRDNRLDRKSVYFIESIKDSIDMYLESFTQTNINWNSRFISLIPESSADYYAKNGVILAAVGWEPDSMVKLLDQTTLFVPDGFWRRVGTGSEDIDSIVEANKLEVDERNQNQASILYNHLGKRSVDPVLRIQALTGLARIKREQNDLREAKLIYRQIYELAKDEKIQKLIIPPAFSLLEQAVNKLFEGQSLDSDPSSLGLQALEIISFLGLPHYYLSERQYLILYQHIVQQYALLAGESADQPIQNSIDTLLAVCNKRKDCCIMFDYVFKRIEKNVTTELSLAHNTRPRNIADSEDSLSVLVCCELHPRYNIALLLDTKELIRKNIPVLEETLTFRNRIAWRLIDEQGDILFIDPDFNSRGDSYNVNSLNLGDWTGEVQEISPGSFAMLLESGQQVYLIGFIFILAVMALGLLLAIRSLSSENKLSQLKSDFVSTVSHEFKSPLTSIRMMSERLANQRVKSEDRKQEYYNSMLTQSERLSHLVENILDFSRMDEGRKTYHFDPCNLADLAREVVTYLESRNKDMGFEIDLTSKDESFFAMVDCESLHQVFYNLVDNAIKYSGRSKKIEVDLNHDGNMIIISVKDYGIGISKKEQKRIFERFYRSEIETLSGIKGSGIGLSIVNEIVKAHHGRIEIVSDLGKGSTFIIYIPVNQK